MTQSIRGVLLGMACGVLFAAPALALDSPGAAGTAVSQGAPEVVIYNDNRALVRQPVELPTGSSRVEMGGLPARIDSTSIRLDGVRVLRQAYHYDVWDADLVFRRCLGDSIFYRYGGRRYRGVLAGIDGNELFILRADSTDVLTIMNRQQLSEIELPRARRLRTTPTLEWELESGRPARRISVTSRQVSGGRPSMPRCSTRTSAGSSSVAGR